MPSSGNGSAIRPRKTISYDNSCVQPSVLDRVDGRQAALSISVYSGMRGNLLPRPMVLPCWPHLLPDLCGFRSRKRSLCELLFHHFANRRCAVGQYGLLQVAPWLVRCLWASRFR